MIKDSKKSKKENIWKASVVTLLPESFPGILNTSLTGKALRDNLWKLEIINLREYGEGRHRNVDDTPYGGGPGMVMRADILGKAIQKMIKKTESAPLIYLSPRGKPFSQKKAQEFAKGPGVNLICGRFEGLDQRLIEHFNIEEVSIGDFILTHSLIHI